MPSSANAAAAFEQWNRKLHYYLGLYLLFFLWLFLLTGLVLNHGQWGISQAANFRVEKRFTEPIDPPTGPTDMDRARNVAKQLELAGEIELPGAQPSGHLDFNIARPSDASTVKVDLASARASVQHFDNGTWMVIRVFHTFSGSRYNAPGHRDWRLTTVWVVAMDALAFGLIVMVLGSYYMWYRLKRTHTLGWLALATGAACCALFFSGFITK